MIPVVDIRAGYTVAEIADEMRRSERTIRRWIADYQIAPVGQSIDGYRYLLAEFVAAEFTTHQNRVITLARYFRPGVS